MQSHQGNSVAPATRNRKEDVRGSNPTTIRPVHGLNVKQEVEIVTNPRAAHSLDVKQDADVFGPPISVPPPIKATLEQKHGENYRRGSHPSTTSASTKPVRPLPALPLLRYVANSAMSAQRRLLRLVLLPPKLLDEAIRSDPDSMTMLGFQTGASVTASDLIDRVKHLQYTALQALLAAYRYSETHVDVKEKVVLGLQIGQLTLDMLGTLQSEIVREGKTSAKRKRSMAEANDEERGEKARKMSSGGGSDIPQTSNVSTPAHNRTNNVRPSPVRIDSSTRADLASTEVLDLKPETEADELKLQKSQARKQEVSRLLKETEDILSSASELGSKSMSKDPEGKSLLLELVMMKAQLTYIQGYHRQAMKLLKSTRQDIQKDMFQTHMVYRMILLQSQLEMEFSHDVMAASTTLTELAALAQSRHDPHVVLLAKVARLRIIMINSFWDLVEPTLMEIDNILDARYPSTSETTPAQETTFERFCSQDLSTHHDAELAVMMEYACFKVIWFHRTGSKIGSKASIKMAHHLHDLPRWSAERSAFKAGVIEVPTRSKPMTMQYMPCNVSTPLTYLITCLAFPDLASNSPKRVKLVQNALKSFDEFDAHEGPYTGDFTKYSGLNNAIAVRSELMELKAECLFDLLTFCTFRAKFEHAEKVTVVLTRHVQVEGLFATFAPRECLMLAQRAHMLGHLEVALKHYQACEFIAKSGSEINLLARVSVHCLELAKVGDIDSLASQSKQLLQECFNTGAYTFTTAARILQGIIADTILSSKKTLQVASDAARVFNDSHLQPLILCIAATHFEETRPAQSRKMLRSALELIRTSQGQNADGTTRFDVVGSTGLGLWALKRLVAMGDDDPQTQAERVKFLELYQGRRRQELEMPAITPA
ncbi:hypothetical protein QFC21_000393 [Naganishia friedmannii]|uniref:Uncharacterized protein n=1 Tax=Naganishia friedmannii TaxID=89922 RepID=A0ACC2WDD3_9TREE|nr:hypothetical protein QFC21_000393 [Naganishia friedmannii]